MRIFLMADNWMGLQVTRHLKSLHENIVGLAIHPSEFQNLGQEIIESSGVDQRDVLIGCKDLDEKFISGVRKLKPDLILVIFWRYLLPEELFSIPPLGAVNFHMSLLPYNRGKNPNVWPIVEGTPAGVTMHYIDSGVDTGKIIAQRQVPVEMVDTAETLYRKQLLSFLDLYIETWPALRQNKIVPFEQTKSDGTFHRAKDFEQLSEIQVDKEYKAIDLINILRSKTFPPHDPAYFEYAGRRYFVSIELREAEIGSTRTEGNK